MFTGIVEALGQIIRVDHKNSNTVFLVNCPFTHELKVDQSLSHNGVCLTVTDISGANYSVTAVKETLEKSNLGILKPGDRINLERCLKYEGRLDGHIVQGHVDCTATVADITDKDGSWEVSFNYHPGEGFMTVKKGSVTVNGVSLTVVESRTDLFSVAIIPYTWENTGFHILKPGDTVNIEFDIIGKYVAALFSQAYKTGEASLNPLDKNV